MDRKTYRAAQHARRTFIRFARETASLMADTGTPADDVMVRSLLHWFKTEYMPLREAAGEVIQFAPMGRALNWREAYLFHDRRRDVLAQFRNRRWFRKPSPLAPLRALEAA